MLGFRDLRLRRPMTKVDKIGPEDWVTVDKIGRTEILGPAKNGC